MATRIKDFTTAKAPWSRRLWDIGTFLALDELHEAGAWVPRKVLAQAAVDWQRHAMERILGDDPAVGSPAFRRELREVLQSSLTVASDGRRRLRYLIDTARPGYLARWASCVTTTDPPRPERVARAVAAHLLDSGHSFAGLQRWIRDGREHLAATDLISEAAALLNQSPRTWKITVPFRALQDYEKIATHLPNWVPAVDAVKAMENARWDSSRQQIIGALWYEIEARDAERAVEIAYDLVERLQARARFAATGTGVVPLGEVLIEDERVPLSRPGRRAQVLSLAAERRLYSIAQDVQRFAEQARSPIDDALEIASGLNDGPLAPAVAGGWAALESLLTEARDPDEREKVVAASRAAALVTCSWPRAELTALSYRVREATGTDLTQRLSACETNRERAALIADEIQVHGYLPLDRSWRTPSDTAAVVRMKELLANRRQVLGRVRFYVEVSLRRLYRSRNIVLHGGSIGGVALTATLRVTAPLVGAALDRITHAHIVDGTHPLILAAKAESALNLIDDELAPGLCDLIE
ncbi:hypothetical protein [Actinoallomurus vinaceus]|uniref:hypothetical protein n=1 Tax=Actinoallomurus vinaceus TaxID=1080074 RepID=UPI0031EDB317